MINSIKKCLLICLTLLLVSFDAYEEKQQHHMILSDDIPTLSKEMKLRVTLEVYSNIKEYKMIKYGKKKYTFCNIFARDILDNREYMTYKTWFGCFINAYAYDVSMIFPRPDSVLDVKISTAYWRAVYFAKTGKIKNLTPEQAQKRANAGTAIWIVSERYNHEALVCPDFSIFDSKRGVLVAQAGEYNGVFYISDPRAFGNRASDPEIKYYEFPERK